MKRLLRNKIKDQAPILWLNNDRDTSSSNHSVYMNESMRYIRVDVRSKCRNLNSDSKAFVG